MTAQIFVNLPVKDLARSKEFFAKLGYGFDPQFTNDNAACMIISESIFCMLLKESFFATFTKKQVADGSTTTEVILALTVPSREKVDEQFNKAIKAGGQEASAAENYSFMYSRSFEDLDGHIWEVFWMDPAHLKSNQ